MIRRPVRLRLCVLLLVVLLLGGCRCDRRAAPGGPVLDLRGDAGARR